MYILTVALVGVMGTPRQLPVLSLETPTAFDRIPRDRVGPYECLRSHVSIHSVRPAWQQYRDSACFDDDPKDVTMVVNVFLLRAARKRSSS
jgi:hypothetical protein